MANLPPRNPNFAGRADLLDRFHQRLHPGHPAAVVQVQTQTLHGLGAVGKTQLALEYAHRHASNYDLVWWVGAEAPAARLIQRRPHLRADLRPAPPAATIQAAASPSRERHHRANSATSA